jgi:hypothetical protein
VAFGFTTKRALVKVATQALKHIRDIGFGRMDDEAQEESNRAMVHRPRPKRLYPSLGV